MRQREPGNPGGMSDLSPHALLHAAPKRGICTPTEARREHGMRKKGEQHTRETDGQTGNGQ